MAKSINLSNIFSSSNINNVLYIIILVLSLLILRHIMINKDNFEDCPCPPLGLVQFSAPECTGDKLPSEQGKCGEIVQISSGKIKARCMGEGIAFPCKNI